MQQSVLNHLKSALKTVKSEYGVSMVKEHAMWLMERVLRAQSNNAKT